MKLMYANRQGQVSMNSSRLKSDVDHFLPGPSVHRIARGKVQTNVNQKQLVSLIRPAQRNRWLCRICGKSLSSKRSYDEHMNIHNDARPFACDHCDYAAASQMTLRRHKLRSHTARRDWGYKCPYCYESYMEPASYQQHVQSRHFGRSATFGCPYTQCSFHSKCFRHFREHLAKHNSYDCYVGQPDRLPFSLPDDELNRFLVDDEYGYGYRMNGTMCRVQFVKRRSCTALTIASAPVLPIKVVGSRDSPPRLCAEVADDFMKEPIRLSPKSVTNHRRLLYKEPEYSAEPIRLKKTARELCLPDTDWVEVEIEVPLSEIPLLPDGQMDIELD